MTSDVILFVFRSPPTMVQPVMTTAAGPRFSISNHSAFRSLAGASGSNITSVITIGCWSALAHQEAEPGVPRSPAAQGVVDVHQLAPTLLSRVGSRSDIDAPSGSGKVF